MWMTIKGVIEFGIRQHQPLNQRSADQELNGDSAAKRAEKMMDVM